MKISEICQQIGGTLYLSGQPDRDIVGINNIKAAGQQHLAFADSLNFIKEIANQRSFENIGALILPQHDPALGCAQIEHVNPRFAFATAANLLCHLTHPFNGISDEAHIDPTSQLGANVRIGPYAFIGPDAIIGDNSVIYPFAAIYDHVKLGNGCVIHSHVTLYHGCQLGDNVTIHAGATMGADGFGYARGENTIVKIPQIGQLIIGDNVEIGSLTNIDRGAMNDTMIGNSTKIDSLVQVAHNVTIGENCIICGQAGLAGSSIIGHGSTLAAQTGVGDHVKIGADVVLGARGGAVHDLPEPGVYHGFPAIPTKDFWRTSALQRQLPQLRKELTTLRKKISELEQLVK